MTVVSVIMPVYNRPAKALRALRSVEAQVGLAARDIEIIAVDDGSTPPLELPETDIPLRVVRLERNSGAAAARNTAIAEARGTYLAFLDSDDLWLPGKLARQLEFIRREERNAGERALAVSCGFYYPADASGRLEQRIPHDASTLAELASGCWFCPGTCLVLRRSVFEKIGPFDTSLRRLEDYDWFLRFGTLGGALAVDRSVEAIIAPSHSVKPEIITATVGQLARKHLAGANRLPPEARKSMRAYLNVERAAALIASGRPVQGGWWLARSLAVMPRMGLMPGQFWDRSRDVPGDVLRQYELMLQD